LDTKAQTSLTLVSSLVQLWICILVSIWWLIQIIHEFSLLLRIKKKLFSPLQPKYFGSQGAVCRKLIQHWLIDCLIEWLFNATKSTLYNDAAQQIMYHFHCLY
jgi:hypothetical protein